MRSHQTRMTRIARMIYMLSQCKDAIDNPAAPHSREPRELKNLNFGGYSRRVNQSGACSSSDVITSGGRKSETTMEDKVIVFVCGYPELYIHLCTFTKTGIHFVTRLELPGRSPSHDAYSRLLCSEFHARISRANEASKLKMFKRPTSGRERTFRISTLLVDPLIFCLYFRVLFLPLISLPQLFSVSKVSYFILIFMTLYNSTSFL